MRISKKSVLVIGVAVVALSAAVPGAGATTAKDHGDPNRACGGHIFDYTGSTYTGWDSTEFTEQGKKLDAKGKKLLVRMYQVGLPLKMTTKFYRADAGAQWVDVTFEPDKAAGIKDAKDKTGYSLNVNRTPVQVQFNAKWAPTTTVGSRPDNMNTAGQTIKQIDRDRHKGYSFTHIKAYKLDATGCPAGSKVPEKLSYKEKINRNMVRTVELTRVR